MLRRQSERETRKGKKYIVKLDNILFSLANASARRAFDSWLREGAKKRRRGAKKGAKGGWLLFWLKLYE